MQDNGFHAHRNTGLLLCIAKAAAATIGAWPTTASRGSDFIWFGFRRHCIFLINHIRF